MKLVVTKGIKKTVKLLTKETLKARKIDWGMTKSFYIDEDIATTCRQAVARGVDERLLGPVNKKTLLIAKKYLSLGVKVKSIPLEEFKFGIRDDILARFWIGKRDSIFCIWIYDKKVNKHFRKMYEQLFWDRAKNVK